MQVEYGMLGAFNKKSVGVAFLLEIKVLIAILAGMIAFMSRPSYHLQVQSSKLRTCAVKVMQEGTDIYRNGFVDSDTFRETLLISTRPAVTVLATWRTGTESLNDRSRPQ